MSLLEVGGDVNVDDGAITVLSEELENLESSFNKSLETIENIIKFYEIDLDSSDASTKAQDIFDQITMDPRGINELNSKIYQNEKQYQNKYREQLTKTTKLHDESFDKIQPNLELIYDQYVKNKDISSLTNNIDDITPFELSNEQDDNSDSNNKPILNLDLNKEQLLNLIQIEKNKRFHYAIKNEKILEPKIKTLEKDFEKWSNRERELKKFFNVDLENINKKIQIVKRTEDI